MIHAVQKGTLKKSKVSKNIRRMAKSINPESVSHFAKTKHSKLPEKKSSYIEPSIELKNALISLNLQARVNRIKQMHGGFT